ncbi:DUF2147 domain-containing protein [Fulvimarina endophytica]|uniref:DUF2147 domain-containing protein n=1 Tax=Fulvimarina endophytica TaxID=2293836 RepID=A0A371XAW1_9HYPH|nr:DUF2147 domain-containing protein [Fulvimarina endophytica]
MFASPFSISRHASALAAAGLCAAFLSASPASAGPGLTGSWQTEDGEVISIEPCGDRYCASVATGAYKGASVAHVSGPGPEYKGRVSDPRDGKSYPGSLILEGRQIAVKGCIMEVFCKTVQHWQQAR